MKSDSMILNSFDYIDVERVYKQLKFGNGERRLIAWGSPNDFHEGTQLILSYDPMFHRVQVKAYKGGTFYANPSVELRLVTESIFINSIGISADFEKLFNNTTETNEK